MSGFFVGGLPRKSVKSLRAQPDGKVLITDGPCLEIGGFGVVEAANLDEALAWGRRAVVACRAPVEVYTRSATPAFDSHVASYRLKSVLKD